MFCCCWKCVISKYLDGRVNWFNGRQSIKETRDCAIDQFWLPDEKVTFFFPVEWLWGFRTRGSLIAQVFLWYIQLLWKNKNQTHPVVSNLFIDVVYVHPHCQHSSAPLLVILWYLAMSWVCLMRLRSCLSLVNVVSVFLMLSVTLPSDCQVSLSCAYYVYLGHPKHIF